MQWCVMHGMQYVMHGMPKGRRDAEAAEVAELWRRKNTSGMSFALDIALSFEAIWQNSSTSVLAQKTIKMHYNKWRMKNEEWRMKN